ncbi:MAG: glucose 1-dehydrogenase [Bacteroidota bacterium]
MFQDKVVLITGAASGIGKATAEAYAEKGATVVLSDISAKAGEELVHQMQERGAKATFIPCNVANSQEVKSLIDQAVSTQGKIDIAVNNAGVGPDRATRTHQHSLEDWDKVISVNQSGVFYCMKYELEQMLQQGHGNIINIASMAGLKALPNNVAYVASKHAVVGMTKTAALEYARKSIRINAICPVFTSSPMLDRLLSMREDMDQRLLSTIPMGRFADAKEIVEAIQWLSSEASSFVNGVALPVDGGHSA